MLDEKSLQKELNQAQRSRDKKRIQDAVAHLYRFYYRLVFYILRSKLDNLSDIEDGIQETFLSLVNAVMSKEVKNAKGFLAITASRIALKMNLEGRSKEEFNEEAFSSPGEDFSLSADLSLAMGKLSRREQDVIVFRDIYGLSYKEIAKLDHSSVDAVEALHRRAIAKMKESMRKEKP